MILAASRVCQSGGKKSNNKIVSKANGKLEKKPASVFAQKVTFFVLPTLSYHGQELYIVLLLQINLNESSNKVMVNALEMRKHRLTKIAQNCSNFLRWC